MDEPELLPSQEPRILTIINAAKKLKRKEQRMGRGKKFEKGEIEIIQDFIKNNFTSKNYSDEWAAKQINDKDLLKGKEVAASFVCAQRKEIGYALPRGKRGQGEDASPKARKVAGKRRGRGRKARKADKPSTPPTAPAKTADRPESSDPDGPVTLRQLNDSLNAHAALFFRYVAQEKARVADA